MIIECQTELHRHIDVSLRTSTAWELAKTFGLISQSTSLDSFRSQIILDRPLSNLDDVLKQFLLFQGLFKNETVLERIGYEAAEDVYQEGTRQIEFRFSPAFATEKSGMPWQVALDSFHRGIDRFTKTKNDFKAGLILIASREYGPDAAEETIDLAIKNRNLVIAVDLAGAESHSASKMFAPAFKRAHQAGLPITIHAGEGTSADAVWQAIEDLYAKRIGHGIASIEDPKLINHLAKHSICLEICPKSNWLTQVAKTWADQPLATLLRKGVPVTINTDDPGFFGNTIPTEIEICRSKLGMTDDEIVRCFDHAKRSSFL